MIKFHCKKIMKRESKMKNTIKKAYALLELERHIVGVKLAKSKEELAGYDAVQVVSPISYCVAVKSATLGHSVKFDRTTTGCGGSTRALGLTEPTEGYYDGSEGCKLGLYSDSSVAAGVSKEMKICSADTYGVIVKPIEAFEDKPDVVLIVTNSKNAMRIIQGYTYFYGMQNKFTMTGNQALCVEGTAVPIVTGEINVSMFCSGTRFLAGWKDTEVAVGIPIDRFEKTIEGIRLTVNAVEPDERKTVIRKKLAPLGYKEDEIIMGDTYYLRLEREKRKNRRKDK